jgi:prevent-host-death family protein
MVIPMPWNIAQAKQRFSEIVRRTAEGPQLIYNRKRLVAAVINAEDYRAFKEWSERTAGRTLAEELAELRQIMQEESYDLTLPPRSTRQNTFIETLKEEGCELPR